MEQDNFATQENDKGRKSPTKPIVVGCIAALLIIAAVVFGKELVSRAFPKSYVKYALSETYKTLLPEEVNHSSILSLFNETAKQSYSVSLKDYSVSLNDLAPSETVEQMEGFLETIKSLRFSLMLETDNASNQLLASFALGLKGINMYKADIYISELLYALDSTFLPIGYISFNPNKFNEEYNQSVLSNYTGKMNVKLDSMTAYLLDYEKNRDVSKIMDTSQTLLNEAIKTGAFQYSGKDQFKDTPCRVFRYSLSKDNANVYMQEFRSNSIKDKQARLNAMKSINNSLLKKKIEELEEEIKYDTDLKYDTDMSVLIYINNKNQIMGIAVNELNSQQENYEDNRMLRISLLGDTYLLKDLEIQTTEEIYYLNWDYYATNKNFKIGVRSTSEDMSIPLSYEGNLKIKEDGLSLKNGIINVEDEFLNLTFKAEYSLSKTDIANLEIKDHRNIAELTEEEIEKIKDYLINLTSAVDMLNEYEKQLAH